jgi:hypothetical protein
MSSRNRPNYNRRKMQGTEAKAEGETKGQSERVMGHCVLDDNHK